MIWNLGSINIDNFYEVPHLPAAGETLAARSFGFGLGGKGANMSVAAARAAARVAHIGAVGPVTVCWNTVSTRPTSPKCKPQRATPT